MASKRTKIKREAQAWVPEDRDQVDAAIFGIGIVQRERERLKSRMNDAIAEIKAAHERDAAPRAAEIRRLAAGVQTWCEANRATLTREGRVKTHTFAAGEVRWRTRPPRVVIRGAEAVIERLKSLGLGRFVRVREEPDRQAMLAEPKIASAVEGVTIGQGEDFVILPLETELEEVM